MWSRFFDSLINQDGIFVDIFDENGNETPGYGPEPDEAGHDFFAHPTDNQFAFPYDPTNTVAEYFQDGFAGDPMPFPDPADVALNAKIVATFYSANWLHDVFYRAGFDEVAGNAQESNLGRGGVEGDPLIVHAGFPTTFTFPGSEGVSPVLDPDHNRTRMAEYLVAGLAAFPDRPSMLDARNAILAVVRLASPHVDYPACRAGFASRGMGAGALGPDREFGSDPDVFPPPDYDPADITESFVDADRALHVAGSTFTPGTGSAIQVDIRNTGLVDLLRAAIVIRPAVAAAVAFPDGPRAELVAVAPEDVAMATVAAVVDPCALPADPTQPGLRTFDYTVEVTSPGREPIQVSAAFHTAIAATCPAP
jgi:Fungalysin metallopeptidase (M36)